MRRLSISPEKAAHGSSLQKSVHRSKAGKKGEKREFIHFGHSNWNLVLHMMLGVSQSVRNVLQT